LAAERLRRKLVKVGDLSWGEIEARLGRDDRCVLPLGCTEQHAQLSLATDTTLAERLAVEAAEPLEIPVFPAIPYGITPYFMAYPGTVSVSPTTYERLVTEVLASLRKHGFARILVVNGHGGNAPIRPAVEAWARRRKGVTLRWHDWWKAPRTRAAIDAIDPQASHASWMESFPWTRVAGADPPRSEKPRVEMTSFDVSPKRIRASLGDGSYGGAYRQPDDVMLAIWKVAVEETRAMLVEGW
jgi:creatinine amidohydrolase